MIWFLRIVFSIVLVTMLVVTIWASRQVAMWDTPRAIFTHPWVVATFFDTWFAFLTFYCWVAYKETSAVARVLWLVAIVLLGNIAMATYMLIQLFRLPPTASMEDLLLRRKA